MSLVRLALYHPEIPQNTGTLLRLGACLDVSVDIIEPCGFIWDSKKLKRSGMDYIDKATFERHLTFNHFQDFCKKDQPQRRILLMDVSGTHDYLDIVYQPNDVILMGRESDGVPEEIKQSVDQIIRINMHQGRSLNMAVAATLVIGEALRQTRKT